MNTAIYKVLSKIEEFTEKNCIKVIYPNVSILFSTLQLYPPCFSYFSTYRSPYLQNRIDRRRDANQEN